ncbi:ABC transporter permease [Streptomyces sp. NBC_01803]|uniref:ABC transporter permease n=1 Tax=Streptomyces sp. NBC_01803 TaxID=2975946 RepID=UPI002DD90D55|nr:iron ABC transporter permease [Streptomyces sp. NBC_01803]WSA42769.1 iron ABC transporter permease [Streptomyces sp. NBC_01803]
MTATHSPARDAAPAPPARRRSIRRGLPTVVLLALLVLLVVLPAGFVLRSALTTESGGGGAWTLDNFDVLFTSTMSGAMLNSALVGLGSTALALLFGCGLAFLAARTDVPGRRLIYFFGILPLFLPAFVGALAWAVLGSPASGLINLVLSEAGLPRMVDIYSYGGVVFVLGLYYAPYAFMLVHAALSLMNPDLEDAANLHGAGTGAMLRTVSFPLVTPAVLGSAVLIFALTVENFPVAQVIGVPGQIDTLPTLIYRLMNASPARSGEAAAVAVFLTVLLMLAVAGQHRMVARTRFTTLTGKGVRARRIPLGRWRLPALAAAVLYFFLSMVLPVAALTVAALQTSPYLGDLSQLGEPGALSVLPALDVIGSEDFHAVLRNSVIVGVGAAVAGTALCFALSYTRHRTASPGRGLLEYVAMLPLAVPAIVLGLGLLWTWLAIPLPVFGTLLVLIIACVAVFLPQGFRGVSSSILQLDRDLEDSAVMLGAARARAIATVTVPLLRVGLSSTFLLLLMLAMRELTAVLFLYTTDTRVLSIAIFDVYDNGSLHDAALLSLLYCAVIGVLAAVTRRLGAKEAA